MRLIGPVLALCLSALPAVSQGVSDLAQARAFIAAGDLQAALAPLERILLVRPNADDARLLYARTLFDLGDFEGAERELALLEGRLNPENAAYAKRLRSDSAARSKLFRGRASLYVGLRAATDPDLGFDGKGDDLAASAGVVLRLEREIQGTGGGYLFGDLNVRTTRYDQADELNGVNAQLSLGVSLPYGDLTLAPFLAAATSRTDDGGKLAEYGGGLSAQYALGTDSALTAEIAGERREQSDTRLRGGGEGARVSFGYLSKPLPGLRTGIELSYEEFSAEGDGFSYTAPTVSLEASYALQGGSVIFGRANIVDRDYDTARDELLQDYFVGYARPLDIAGVDNLTVQIGARHQRRRSSIAGRDGEDTSIEVTLLRGFEF